MNRFLVFGIVLLIIFFIASAFSIQNYFLSFSIALVFPLLFLVFLIKIDVFERENFKDVIYVFLFSLVISFFLCIPYVFFRDLISNNPVSNLFSCFLLVGIPEEIIKIVPFLMVLKYRKYVNEPIDYLIYGSSSALGFAFYENINYLIAYYEIGNIVAIRSFLPSLMHMIVTSIFSFCIFLYVQSNHKKYLFIGLVLSSLIHSVYNTSFILSPIILLFILLYYSKMIQSLLNISPYYDKSKENSINQSNNFLFILILIVLISSFLFDLYLNGFDSILSNSMTYLYMIILPFFVYRIITSKLVLKKGSFTILGKRKNSKGVRKEMQQIIIDYYRNIR